MDSRKARWIALSASSAVALAILWFGLARLEKPMEGTVTMHVGERPKPPPRTATSSAAARTLDPVKPEEWTFHLSPEEAETFFAMSLNPRVVYDPWMGVRELGNEVYEFKWAEHPKHKFEFRTNSDGCREDHDLDVPPRDLRVLVAGDSHTCGLCANAESFTNRLEDLIAAGRPGKTVEALNTGLGGYHFYNYLGALYRFRDFAPQVFVCSIFGGNDFSEYFYVYLHLAGGDWPSLLPKFEKRRKLALEVSFDAMGQGLAELDLLRNFEHLREPISDHALQMCLEIQRVARRQGTEVVFLYIPSPFELPWPEPVERYTRARDTLELTDADFSLVSAAADRLLARLRERGATTVDLRPTFASEPVPPYWRTDFHLNVRGHELAARALEPVVSAMLKVD
ncbi:MAG: SGNH/GDSL hydrolase family protein [Planctomycetes bacterium]|nr:SGNH/GDSL hydrolase family protein [Planctomycetota bacterium]